MVDKKYRFYDSWWISIQAYLGKALRRLRLLKDLMPPYMPIHTIKTTLHFETVAEFLESNLYQKEADYYKAHDYLPSFQEMMVWNEEYRLMDWRLFIDGKKPTFHSTFRDSTCSREKELAAPLSFYLLKNFIQSL
jgi:hypothetical protein